MTKITKDKYWVVIPAAGLGLRMGSDVPKQYMQLAGKTMLERVVELFASHDKVQRVVVALHPEDGYWSRLTFSNPHKIITTVGGKTRAESVWHALDVLQGLAQDHDWVLVHDAARPCVKMSDVENLMRQLYQDDVGGLLGMQATDTIKIVENGEVQETIPREKVWRAQTPQMFRYAVLYQAMRDAIENNAVITDEASAVELAGHHPKIFQASPTNIKITYPEDVVIAERNLEGKN